MSSPSKDSLENAFVRLPRPQKVLDPGKILVPTRSALIQVQIAKSHDNDTSLPMPPQHTRNTSIKTVTESTLQTNTSMSALGEDQCDLIQGTDLHPLSPVIIMGTLTQDRVKWELRAQRGRSRLLMVKSVKHDTGLTEQQVLETLNHRNIAKLVHASIKDERLCLAMEYCRFTLAEILFVHLNPEEQQVQYIARSVSLIPPLRYAI
jgi:hypothetical protein